MSRQAGVSLSPYVARQILKARGISMENMSIGIGPSAKYLQYCLNRCKMPAQSIMLLKEMYGVDLSSAIRVEEPTHEVVEVTPVSQESIVPQELRKIIEDYSYERSNDSDRIVNALKELTERIEELIGALK